MADNRVNPLNPPVPLTPARRPGVRSPSRSPERNTGPSYQPIDPLLSNLSPESTLEALTSTDAVPNNEKDAHDILSKSISQVSPAERALGVRAAIAAQRLDLWYKKIQTWEWPKKQDAQRGKGFVPPSGSNGASSEEAGSGPEYYGCLPAEVVGEYEDRIEDIRDGMDDLDVDELKEHVLSAHIPSWSRPSSSGSTISVPPPPLTYVQLSDFTAVITATILRALPLLSRLNSLLATWDVRLLSLRQVPGLLRGLRQTRFELNSSLNALKSSNPPREDDAVYSRANFLAKRAELEAKVVAVGRRMDRILDGLEGREDSLPERWIDEMEAIESDFGSWVIKAERRTVENEWRRVKQIKVDQAQRQPAASGPMETINEEEPNSVPERVAFDSRPSPSLESTSVTSTTTPSVSSTNRTPSPDAEQGPRNADADALRESDSLEDNTPTAIQSPIEPEPEQSPLAAKQSEVSAAIDGAAPSFSLSDQPDVEIPRDKTPVANPPIEPEHQQSPVALSESANDHSATVDELVPSPPTNEQSEETRPKSQSSDTLPEKTTDFHHEIGADQEEQSHTQLDSDHDKNLPISSMTASVIVQADDHESQASSAIRPINNDEGPTTLDRETTEAARIEELDSSEAGKPPSRFLNSSPTDSDHSASSTPRKAPVDPFSTEFGVESKPLTGKVSLESPIYLPKTRQEHLSPENVGKKPVRGLPSSASADSFPSDYPSLVSSPDGRYTGPTSSSGTPQMLQTPPQSHLHHSSRLTRSPSHGDHTLREDRLLRLGNQKNSPRTPAAHNRAVSLPLQRFMNEEPDLSYGGQVVSEGSSPGVTRRASVASAGSPQASRAPATRSRNNSASIPTNTLHRLAARRGTSGGDRPRSTSSSAQANGNRAAQRHSTRTSSPDRSSSAGTPRLKRQPKAYPGLGLKRNDSGSRLMDDGSAESASEKTESRSSTPARRSRKPRDQMDEKISTLLSTIPGHIRLVSSSDQDIDSSSAPLSSRPRLSARSDSRQTTSSRLSTSALPMTLTPAPSHRRHSYTPTPEQNLMKVYHLHRGGESVPTKLFVRIIGEEEGRVMVRVGGGWADLGEYLREYAIHHGRRSLTETPRVEVKNYSPNYTPGYSPSMSSDRGTPRPPSVISARPSSSISVRKKRRSSNVSTIPDLNISEALDDTTSPVSPFSSHRRLSVSSNTSFGATSFASEARAGSATPSALNASLAPSTPLGMAGPKPRSRQVSMSPESEAWVEGVLGQARRHSSLHPHKLGGLSAGDRDMARTPTLAKSRSIGDLASSKRVVLRGLKDRNV